MIVSLDLGQQVRLLLCVAVTAIAGRGEKAAGRITPRHGGIVLVGGKNPSRVGGVGVFDHVEQAQGLRLAVQGPLRVEDLVAAMLGIGLGEHHQLDVGGVAQEGSVTPLQIRDLILRQGQAQARVGLSEGLNTPF